MHYIACTLQLVTGKVFDEEASIVGSLYQLQLNRNHNSNKTMKLYELKLHILALMSVAVHLKLMLCGARVL